MNRILLTLAALLLAAPLAAQRTVPMRFDIDNNTGKCTNGRIGQGSCDAASVGSVVAIPGKTAMTIDFDSPDFKDLVDSFSSVYGRLAQVTCEQEMVDAGDCLAAELGTEVANPQGKRAFMKMKIRDHFAALMNKHLYAAAVEAVPRPDISTTDEN